MTKIHKYAWLGLIFSLLGYLPKVGHFFSLAGFISGIMMYRELDLMGVIKGSTKLYILISIFSLLAVLLATLGWIYGHGFAIVFSVIAYILGIVIAWLTFRLYRQFAKMAAKTEDSLFKISAIMLKIAAFTMPILIGFLIQGIAQLVIFVAVIRFKSREEV